MASGSWRRGRLQLAMTEIDSGLTRELEYVESRPWLRAALVSKETFFKKETEVHCAGTSYAAEWPRKREECGHDLLPLSAPH